MMNEAQDKVMQPIRNSQTRIAMVKALGNGEDAEKAADFMIKTADEYTPLRYIAPPGFQTNSSQFKVVQAISSPHPPRQLP